MRAADPLAEHVDQLPDAEAEQARVLLARTQQWSRWGCQSKVDDARIPTHDDAGPGTPPGACVVLVC
jgi:hypothetical protein